MWVYQKSSPSVSAKQIREYRQEVIQFALAKNRHFDRLIFTNLIGIRF